MRNLSRFGALVFLAVCQSPAVALGQAAWNVSVLNDIGSVGHASHELEFPVGALRLDNGDIVVAFAHAGSVVAFSPSGAQRWMAGRPGTGPGEFRHIGWLGKCGNTIFAWDLSRLRMIAIDLSGRFLREFYVESESPPVRPQTITCRGSQFAFHGIDRHASMSGSSASPILRGAGPVWLADSSGHPIRSVATAPSTEAIALGGGGSPLPLGKSTTLALVSNRLYIATGDSSYVDVYGLDGSKLTGFQINLTSRSPSQKNYEKAIDEIVSNVRGVQISEEIRKMLLARERPKQLPSYARVFVDPDELVWIQTSFPGDAETRLLVFDGAGKQLATVSLPPNLKLFEIGRDFIVAGYDAMSEPHVVVYKLDRK